VAHAARARLAPVHHAVGRIADRQGHLRDNHVLDVKQSYYPKCGSGRRSEYWGKVVNRCAGLRADGTPYTAIIRRRCRCLDCGQVRIDKEYA